ncbi:uncharacterized protein A4U43_C04F760 [Asparagus officinalis]|uniref:Uncharacterized protein n=2 Tax=Asparagus officinalis TaxID=4686 RepID=A0A5P1EXY1_ASPOF|nr:uncharacterized protein A4U43_C04F760 [Asparagus officinalis]
MGLKKGPWTEDEDMVLVSYIQRYGHGNWRALPKQAGLLRCGKSCRLRWTNYLRPDIKRGNFSREEEDMIINLHEMLGNRWSAIAARLPGRTDNEIKNVWHTHLKKRLQKPADHSVQESNSKVRPAESKTAQVESKSIKLIHQNSVEFASNPTVMQTIPIQSSSEDNSTGSISSNWSSSEISGYDMGYLRNESMESLSQEHMATIDDSFWNEAFSMDLALVRGDASCNFDEQSDLNSLVYDEDVEFWLRTFTEVGELHDFPEL